MLAYRDVTLGLQEIFEDVLRRPFCRNGEVVHRNYAGVVVSEIMCGILTGSRLEMKDQAAHDKLESQRDGRWSKQPRATSRMAKPEFPVVTGPFQPLLVGKSIFF
jgi:hypothetical protein